VVIGNVSPGTGRECRASPRFPAQAAGGSLLCRPGRNPGL